ncbi:MAG TPA: phospholipase D-like domain-containing protein [Candidatus Nanoarchaeia archaeon]|nr:phospholipase D-like domain-containing protein [Candidatus Nanoarchaeia archaeon]
MWRWLLIVLLVSGCAEQVAVVDHGLFDVVLCSQVDCFQLFVDAVARAATVDCALFSVSPLFLDGLQGKDVRLVVDRSQQKRVANFSSVKIRWKDGLMHNKFCVIDDKLVLTGSFNVVAGRSSFDHVVVSTLPSLVGNYQQEFDELFDGVFSGGSASPLMITSSSRTVESYFCPDDGCEDRVLALLSSARSSVHFLLFSFTSDKIGDVVLQKFHDGLDVSGVVAAEQISSFSEVPRLQAVGVPIVVADVLVHHKVFIVDNVSLVLGSYNPTRNGDKVNDENLLIVHDARIAQVLLQEMDGLMVR